MNTKQNATVLLLTALVLAAYFLLPPSGNYRLKSGQAACPTEDDVVAYRGARMFGILATSMVIASRKCEHGNQTFKIMRRAAWVYLPYKVKINGRVMYADHDALEKV